jgi:hypothetical protein
MQLGQALVQQCPNEAFSGHGHGYGDLHQGLPTAAVCIRPSASPDQRKVLLCGEEGQKPVHQLPGPQ